jgi:heme exporter protein A
MLELSQLACDRGGETLFQGLSAKFLPGELCKITGPNGSGKSTLLRVLATLSNQFEGDIFWDNQSLSGNLQSYLSGMLYLGHKVGINPQLTARENLQWLFPVAGSDIDCALAACGLDGYQDEFASVMSRGQRQRLALARLVLSPATLWLLDEPFTALDVDGVKFLETMLQEKVEHGGIVLVTTHHAMLGTGFRQIELTDYCPALSRPSVI